MSDYFKLTKKELLYTLLARDVMLKDCRERFELHKNTDAKTIQDQSDLIEELKAKLAESENKLGQYPYKNDVIEKQYEELKDGIKFRIENNITDDWEQHYHCIDVLCEKHKAIIRDIEDGICRIEQLEQQLAEKEKEIETLKKCGDTEHFYGLLEDKRKENKILIKAIEQANQDKISFAVDILEELADCSNYINSNLDFECGSYVSEKVIRDKIKCLKGNKDE